MEHWQKVRDRIGDVLRLLPHHQNLVRVLSTESLDGMPNVLLYGSTGFPIDLLWEHALQQRFLPDGTPFHRQQRTWGGAEGIVYQETPFFLEIDLANPFQPKDLSGLKEFVKGIVQHPNICTQRHIFVLRNIERIAVHRPNMYAFRVILERYSGQAWFICTTYQIGRVEPPIRSRFWDMRTPLPTEAELARICNTLDIPCTEEGVATRNLAKVCLFANAPAQKKDGFFAAYPPLHTFFRENTAPTPDDMRTMAHKLVTQAIPFASVAAELVEHVPQDQKHIYLVHAARAEHMWRCGSGHRDILHYEHLLYIARYPQTLRG